MRDRRAWIVVALAVVMSTASPVLAQPDEVEMPEDEPPIPDVAPAPGPDDGGETPPTPPPADDPATKAAARKLLDGGDAFLKKGDAYAKRKKPDKAIAEYERALAAYQKAYELVPNPKILFPIAIAEQKLERHVDSAKHFRQYLNDAGDSDPKTRADAESRLETIKLNIGVLKLEVTPEGAVVTIEGNEVGTAPLALPVFLAPGEYTLNITADGYKPLEQKLTIEAGSESERSFELESAAVIIDAPVKPPPPPEPPPAPPAPSKMMLYVAGGATLAFLAGATTTGIIAMSKQSTFEKNPDTPAGEDARKSGKSMALLTDGLILGTVVAGGLTAYYYTKIYKPKHREWEQKMEDRKNGVMVRREPPPRPKFLVTPWVQGDGGGLVLTAPL
jgi:hypothetical protein